MDSDFPTSIGRLGVLALDCPDALALADFYNSILGGDVPQQAHIDIDVANLDGAEVAVLRLGAQKATTQPRPDRFPVMIDPAGHPFCLVLAAT